MHVQSKSQRYNISWNAYHCDLSSLLTAISLCFVKENENENYQGFDVASFSLLDTFFWDKVASFDKI